MIELLIDCSIHLARRKWFLLTVVFASCLLASGIVLILPQRFQSHVRLLPSAESKSIEGLGGLGGGLGIMLQSGLGLGIGKDSKMEVLLSSDALPLAAIRRFHLDSVWELQGRGNIPENQIRQWNEAFKWEIQDNGALDMGFEDGDPMLAQRVVEYVTAWTDSAYQETGRARARNQLAFIEDRLAERKLLMQAAEDSLATFQSRNLIFSADEQIKQTVTAAATLESQLELLKIQRSMAVATLGPSSPQVSLLDVQARQLATRLRSFVNGNKQGDDGVLHSLRPALPLRLAYERLKREQTIHATVFGLLVQQREQLLIESVKNVPVLTVIDPPSLPKKRSWPPRVLLVKVAFFLSLAGAAAYVILMEEFRRNSGSPVAERFRILVRSLRPWNT